MKKNLTLRILALVAALLVAVMTLASCSADSPVGDMAPGLGPADQNTAGGEVAAYEQVVVPVLGNKEMSVTVTVGC